MSYSLEHGFLDLPYTEMVWIEPDSFLFQEGEKETKQITFERGFWASKYPVTQELYLQIMDENPYYFKGKHRPVERVSWKDAQAFLTKLNGQVKLNDGLAFHLPSEAMWEYVARANEKTQYSGSNRLAEVAWYAESSYDQTMPVGLKEPNGFELYDLSANVWERCTNTIENIQKRPTDKMSSDRLSYLSDIYEGNIIRGGAYDFDDDACWVNFRIKHTGEYHVNNICFRIFRY